MSGGTLHIALYPHESECIICDKPLFDCRKGLPMHEGEVVENDAVEWGGFDCCDACYAMWERGGAAAINAYADRRESERRETAARGGG